MSDSFTPDCGRTVAVSLTRYAARRAPPELAERLEEEWLADLADQPSSLASLSFALGCLWATHIIASDHRAASAALGGHETPILLRSPSMMHVKRLWLAAAAFAVTAAVMCTAVELGVRILPVVARLSGSHAPWGLWISLAVGAGSILGMIAICGHQVRVHHRLPRQQGLGRWTGRALADRPSGSYEFAVMAVVIGATSVLLLGASAQFGFTTMHLASTEVRLVTSGMAAFFAASGAGLLVVLGCAYRIHRHRAGGPAGVRSH